MGFDEIDQLSDVFPGLQTGPFLNHGAEVGIAID